MRVLLVSTYELGHQPLHVASPAAALLRRGHDVRCLDLSVDPWDAGSLEWADMLAFSVPMHTAMRLAMGVARQARRRRPDLPVCLYGLYAPVSRDLTVGRIADRAIAGEYEPALVAWVEGFDDTKGLSVELGRGSFSVPARDLLPPLDRYAHLEVDGEHRLAGYVEASHGCIHRCRHCPVPAVYNGRTRVAEVDLLMKDIAQLAGMGARHITFGDPDFLSGPHHSLRVVRAMHELFPQLTFDCTVKVEHILRHEEIWEELAHAGCLFVVSAIEMVNDGILARLDKGHTRDDASRAVDIVRSRGMELRPSFLPFTPWTTVDDIADILDFAAVHELDVDPVQLAMRLLLPEGSLLLGRPDVERYLDGYDAELLTWRWHAADPGVDVLQKALGEEAAKGADGVADPLLTLGRQCDIVRAFSGREIGVPSGRREKPRLTEPWFC